MAKKLALRLSLLLLIAVLAWPIAAQDDTGDDTTEDTTEDTTTSTSPTSTVDFFAVLCETSVVVDFSGIIQSGYDIYYQVFSASNGGGTALTDLRRVQVSGTYSTSETLNYTGGTLPANTIGSIYVAIAREGTPSSTLYADYTDDIQDGCATASNPTSTSTGSGTTTTPSSSGTTSSTTTSTITNGQFADGTSAILSPFGGYLNPNYIPGDSPVVEIGAVSDRSTPRQATPGLIFAECEDYPVAEPGLVYDNDNVVIYWSWFTRTEAQMLDHITNAGYSVTYYQTLPLPNPQRSEIQVIGGRYWVFYYAVLGNLRPGRYYIEYKLQWDAPHFDGFSDYGPGTETPNLNSGCDFVVLPNPDGVAVNPNPWPYQFMNTP